MADSIVAFGFDPVCLVCQLVPLAQEVVVPGGAFFGLNAVLIADSHQQFARVEQRRQAGSQLAAAGRKVVDQQIGDGVDGCLDANFVVAASKFGDQKDDATGASG